MDKRNYECVFIVRQDATPNQVETFANSISDVVRSLGGEVGKTEFCGLRTLAYRIKKNRKGHYVLMNLIAPAAAIAEMERLMKLNEDILRYLTVRVEELDNNPSALMQRNFREERSRGFDDDFFERDEPFMPSLDADASSNELA